MTDEEWQAIHKFSFENRKACMMSAIVGCFHCLALVGPHEITEWVKDKNGQTAVCPRCGIDSMIPSHSHSVDEALLKRMQDYSFGSKEGYL